MQHSRHPATAACRAAGSGTGGRMAVRAPVAGPEPAPAPAVPQNTAFTWSFPGSALDVAHSRRWLAAAVEQAWGAGDDADRVVLAYSEIATNAVVHGTGPVTVRARIQDTSVTCEVADCSARPPRPCHAGAEDVRGRGLDLVELTVDGFRVDLGEAGKTVSFEVGRRRGAPRESGRSPLSRSGPGPAGPQSVSEVESASELTPESENELQNKSQSGSHAASAEPGKHSSPAPDRGPEPGWAKAGSAGESGGGSTDGGLKG